MTIRTRAVKGTDLTWDEIDENFLELLERLMLVESGSYAASLLITDATHRVVTDVQIAYWDAKQPPLANTDALAEGLTNIYFTAQRVRDTVLAGLSTAAATIVTSAHSVIQAIGFLQAQVTANLAAAMAYADGLVTGLWDDRGNYDASTNLFPAAGGSGAAGAVLKGDIWTVTVPGVLGGQAVAVGATVRALVDAPAQTAGNWAIGVNITVATAVWVEVVGTTQLALAAHHYEMQNAALSTGTLPAAPASGDYVGWTFINALKTNAVARNGKTIMGKAEDFTVDMVGATVVFRYDAANADWRLIQFG